MGKGMFGGMSAGTKIGSVGGGGGGGGGAFGASTRLKPMGGKTTRIKGIRTSGTRY